MVETSLLEQGQRVLAAPLRRCPVPGVERPTHPTHLAYVERGNPVAVWVSPSNPIVRAGQHRSGHKKAQEAKAGTPKGKGKTITCRIAPDGATRKGADVSQVIYPKDAVKVLKPGGKVRCNLLQT